MHGHVVIWSYYVCFTAVRLDRERRWGESRIVTHTCVQPYTCIINIINTRVLAGICCCNMVKSQL